MNKWTAIGCMSVLGCMISTGMAMQSCAAKGWQLENNEWHYYESEDELVTDAWKRSGNYWFYLDESGDMATSRLIHDGDNYYYVNSYGIRVSNQWRLLDNEEAYDEEQPEKVWYYFGSNGKAYRAPDSGRTSFKSIKIASGEVKKYAFDEQGRMLYGWVNDQSQRLTGDDDWIEGIYYCGDEQDGSRAESSWRRLEVVDEMNEDGDFDDTYWFYFGSNGRKVADAKKTINGRKYLFSENGNASYLWQSTATSSNAMSADSYTYYNTAEQCWQARGWFYTVPPKEIDEEPWNEEQKYWFYGLNDDGVATSVLKKIDSKRYGFNEYGEMLHGLYKMSVDEDYTILNCQKIETVNDLPGSSDSEDVYYFGDNPKEGVMATGKMNIELDGERLTYYFDRSGKDAGAGVEGIFENSIYEKGRMLKIDEGLRYGVIMYEGDDYLVNSSGKIQKNRKNLKDAEGVYYSTDNNGVVIHCGDKQ